MKTKQVALMLLAVVFTVSAVATEIPKINVVAVDKSKAFVAAVTSPNVASEVSLIAENGEVVYYKKSKAAKEFKSVLNLSQLEDGTYTVKLKTGETWAQRDVEITDGKLAVKEVKHKTEPFYVFDGDVLKVSYLNHANKNVSMLVYNGSTLVDEIKLGNSFVIHRAFDVSKMARGDFDFVMTGTPNPNCYKVSR